MVDPPHPISPVGNLAPTSALDPGSAASTTQATLVAPPPATVAIPTATLPPNTFPVVPSSSPSPELPVPSTSISISQTDPQSPPGNPSISQNSPTSNNLLSTPNPTPTAIPSPNQAPSPITVSMAISETEVVSASLGGSGSNIPAIILPEGSTLQAGSVTTIATQGGSGSSVVIPENVMNGNVVVSSIGSQSPSTYEISDALLKGIIIGVQTTNFPTPNSNPNPELTGAVVYMDKTLQIGGPTATITSLNAVLGYGASGVVVQYPGGFVSTIPVTAWTKGQTLVASNAGERAANVASLIYGIINGGPIFTPISSLAAIETVMMSTLRDRYITFHSREKEILVPLIHILVFFIFVVYVLAIYVILKLNSTTYSTFSKKAAPVTPITSASSIPVGSMALQIPQLPHKDQPLTPEQVQSCPSCDKRKKFVAHKKLLTKKGEMYLPEDDLDAVTSLIDYMYRGRLPKLDAHFKVYDSMHLYFLAEKVCMSELMDRILDHLRAVARPIKTSHHPNSISSAYKNTNGGNKTRLYLVAEMACRLRSHFEQNTSEEIAGKHIHLFLECTDFTTDLYKFQAKYFK
ncbi:hypothetical protein G7Y89_g7065 [Cudoniella acicularis]|uniref:BTB domain-containing protein n=1 Tax=Cudoniella acicularis TaxID=354080 RepID=A0A8H4RJ81_9HELO|nr:hypothetical protein G7Y89_g7065 [Cudoniella acicularis]